MPSPSQVIEAPAAPPAVARTVCRARALLGTRVEISVQADAPHSRLHAAIDAAFAEIERIHRLMSCQHAHSELSLLNRTAHRAAVPVGADTFAVLQRALQFARSSDGAFDPCVGGALERSGMLPLLDGPTPPGARWPDIELLDGRCVRFARALRLDLSGIAKGYAVDLAVECLQRSGMQSVLVNAGGDLRVAGPEAFQIGLRDPRDPARIAHALDLRQGALATSAIYEQAPGTLLDPRDDRRYRTCGSISVRAARCMDADALTKVVLFAPASLAEKVLAQFDAMAFAMGREAA